MDTYSDRQDFKQDYFDVKEKEPSKKYLENMTNIIGMEKLRMTINNYYLNVRHDVCAVLV